MRYSFFSGSNTWRECAGALHSLFRPGTMMESSDTARYERLFAEAAGTKFAFSLAAGRMALYRILEALDIGPGDEVIIPAFTCVVVPNAILYRGAVPIYVDIDPETYNLNPALIEAALSPRTRAILAQHTFGRICDIEQISKIAEKHSLTVIEDCAHALGAEHRGRKAGSLSRAAFFSTDHSKIISTGMGGMITTDDPALAEKLERLQRDTPSLKKSRIRRILTTFILEFIFLHPRFYRIGHWINRICARLGLWAYFLDEMLTEKPTSHPYPARLSAAQARIGISQLNLLADNIAHRRRTAKLFAAQRRGLPPAAPYSAQLRYTFNVEDRDAWINRFTDIVQLCVWFTSVVEGRSDDLHAVGYKEGSCPIAEEVARHCMDLPTHPRITHPELLSERLAAALDDASGRFRLRAVEGSPSAGRHTHTGAMKP